MGQNKSTKYKITDTNIDKKIVGKQVTVEKVKSKGVPGNDRIPPKKQKSTRDLLIEFMGEQREFNTRIEKDIVNLKNDISLVKKTQSQQEEHFKNLENRMDKQDTCLIKIENRLDTIDNRLDKNDKRFENIEHKLSI